MYASIARVSHGILQPNHCVVFELTVPGDEVKFELLLSPRERPDPSQPAGDLTRVGQCPLQPLAGLYKWAKHHRVSGRP
jgi:hypothetical protein